MRRHVRRVALHPLALDDHVGEETPMPGDLLRKRMSVEMNVTAFSDGSSHIQDGPGRRGAVGHEHLQAIHSLAAQNAEAGHAGR